MIEINPDIYHNWLKHSIEKLEIIWVDTKSKTQLYAFYKKHFNNKGTDRLEAKR